MGSKKSLTLSGDLLVSDFVTVLTGMAMSRYAASEAERSENQLMNQLATLGNSNYLNPGSMSNDTQTDFSRGSLDVHVKKVQAQQLASYSAQQLGQLVDQTRTQYVGRRLVVMPLDYKNPPIDAVWFDNQTGYRTSQFKKRKIVGIIEDVRLDENMLILRPTLQRRLMTPGLQNFLVYIVNPNDLTPLVRLEIA